MSQIDKFWNEISDHKKFRAEMERQWQKEEWAEALPKYSSVVIVGSGHLVKPLRQIRDLVSEKIRCIDLTATPKDHPDLQALVNQTFDESGRFLLLSAGRYSQSKGAPPKNSIEALAFARVNRIGSSHAVCLSSTEHLLSYAAEDSWDTASVVKAASLVLVREYEPSLDVRKEVRKIMPFNFPAENIVFFANNPEPAAEKVVAKAIRLFEAAATL